jgi:hypothetical protein
MLRRVSSLAAIGVLMGAPASAVDLITYPTLVRGTVAFAPVSLATLDFDWLGAFAPDAADGRPTSFQLAEFLSGTPDTAASIGPFGPADVAGDPGSPATDRYDQDWPAPSDF